MKDITDILNYDVAVIGGGPGGIPAAIASARNGKKTIIVERNSFLGGAAASGLGILGYLDRGGNRALGGIAEEFVVRLKKMGGSLGHDRCPVHNSITAISPESFKILAVKMLEEAGADILFDSELFSVEKEGGTIKSVTVFGKGRLVKINARAFIDATGDGDLAKEADVPYISGQDGNGIMQPATLMFTVTDFDLEKLLEFSAKSQDNFGIKEDYAKGYTADFLSKTPSHCFIGLTSLIAKARAEGNFDVPRNQFIYITTPSPSLLAVNTVRITDIDASDLFQLSSGLEKGYEQVDILMSFLNRYVPGFEKAKLASIAPLLGVRETRHFEGEYRLTKDNMSSEEARLNAVAQSAYNIDIHSGNGIGIDLTPVMKPFPIPYLSLVPKTVDNLLLSGRTISLDSITYASARVMGVCIAVGEAAGTAASVALDEGVSMKNANLEKIQTLLRQNGNIF